MATGDSRRSFGVFLQELKRRRVPNVAAIYLVGAWAAVQVLTTVFGAFEMKPLASQIVILAAVAGFPLALVLAWLYDVRPVDIRREATVSAGPLAARARLWAWATLGTVVLLALGVGATLFRESRNPADSANIPAATEFPPDDVAVLYFRDETPGERNSAVAADLTERLIEELSKTPALTVMSSDGVSQFRGKAVPADSVARTLRVGTVVTGSVTGTDKVLRANVQLVDAPSNRVLESRSVEALSGQLIQLTSEVVGQVSTILRQRVGSEVQRREWRAGTRSDRAFENVQLANKATYDAELLVGAGQLGGAEGKLRQADSLLAMAEGADPDWTEPRVLRAWIGQRLWYVGLIGGNHAIADAALARGIEDASRALARHPDDPRALEVRGTLHYWQAFSTSSQPSIAAAHASAADRDLRAAVAHDPHRARAWSALSALRLGMLDFATAQLYATRAFEEDAYTLAPGGNPLETLWRGYESAFELGNDSVARTWCERMRSRRPEDLLPAACALQLMAWGEGPRDVNAAVALRRAHQGNDAPQLETINGPLLDMGLAAVLARAGLRDSAEALVARARNPGLPDLLQREAEVRVLLHQPAAAVHLLEEYLRLNPSRRGAIARGRCFASLRERLDFIRLVREPGLNR